jgi:predicted amidohydrolase YtcJ
MLRRFILWSFPVLFFACSEKETADLIVYNAKIYSVDPWFRTYEAMAIRDGRVIETGSSAKMLSRYDAVNKKDAEGKFIYPGFIDAHCHFTGYATDMWKCNLVGTTSFDDVIRRLRDYAKTAPMHWIYGRGWDQNDWDIKEYPDKTALDKMFPDRPVFLKRIDGHAALVNQAALDMAKVTGTTSVMGGEVIKKDGKLTGLLIDNAMDLVDNIVPLLPDSLATKYYQKAQEDCFRYGLTQVQDCGISEHTAELVDQEHKAGKLKMKVFALLSDDSTYYDRWIKKGVYRTDKLTIGGFKLYADGALGSRGACLLRPYSDKKDWYGFMLRDESYLARVCEKLKGTDFQVCTHAIGDSANRNMLNIYGRVLKGKNEKRWRIEHAQVVNENDFDLFAKYDVIPSVQPTHATSDMYWAEKRLGPRRIKNAYAYEKLLKVRGIIALGTDFPVEGISPIKTFYAAVTRRDSAWYPEGGFLPEEALKRDEALKGMTLWASYSIFEEKKKGSLEKNKVADFVILDTDILMCDEKDILKAKVIETYIDGKPVWQRTTGD